MRYVLVAFGGALGAVARYVVGGWATGAGGVFPLGTLAVNISGSFLLGLFYTLALDRFDLPPEWRLVVAIGFLGGYTTFSTLSYETLKLLEDGAVLIAALNLTVTVVGGLAAIYGGTLVARLL